MKAVSIALFAGMVGCASVQPISAADAVTFKEKVLHSFGGGDGAFPKGALINVNGTLYGTTGLGGAHGNGGVFAVSPNTGAETEVYSFCSQKNGNYCFDGAVPEAGLIGVKGMLYGTTRDGGDVGGGTVFSLDPSTGAEKVLYSFLGGTDGASPEARLIDVKGKMYGTTYNGGNGCGDGGCGTVFSLDLSTGKETVLHSFGGGTDGSEPVAGLIAVNGKLYGTTSGGGTYNAGAVFSIDLTTGTVKVRYSFCAQFGCPDGGAPKPI